MLKVCTARSKVFAWKLKLSWWPWWPPKLFVYFTHSNIAKREIMWRVFALLIYGTHSCKLKLKRLDIDVKRHFCPTINLSYLGLMLTGYFQFLNLIWILSSVSACLPHSHTALVRWRQIIAADWHSYFDKITFYEMGFRSRMLSM